MDKKIFNEIDDYCRSRGYDFQIIDLRWGVNTEAALNQKTIEICLEEVKRCSYCGYEVKRSYKIDDDDDDNDSFLSGGTGGFSSSSGGSFGGGSSGGGGASSRW